MSKRKVGGFSEEHMRAAVEKVIRYKMSIRKAAENYGLKFQTLARYVIKAKANPQPEIRMCPNYEVRQVFSKSQESILVDYIIYVASICYGLTPQDVRKLAYQTAVRNNITMPKSWNEEKMAGKKWFTGFRKRHLQLSIRKPENCSLARASAFNKHTVKTFFDKLEEVYSRDSHFSSGHHVWNLDETATSTVSRSPKVVTLKGVRQVNQVTSSERGQLTTTCCFISASGNTLPPIIVYPRAKFRTYMTRGAPSGTKALCSGSGWMTDELFPEVMAHFIKFSNASKDNPMVLIYDNHSSHVSLDALLLAKENGITILTIPPHTSHKLQPLDVSVYSSFKSHFSNAAKKWMEMHPGQTMTLADIPELISIAHIHSMTPKNILSGFQKTGIFPYNPNIFTDNDFYASKVTDRDIQNPPTSPKPENETPQSENKAPSDFIGPFEFKGIPKAAPRKKGNQGRKPRKCIIATDAEELEKLQMEKTNRKIQSVKKRKIHCGELSEKKVA